MSLPALPERVFYAMGVANYDEPKYNSAEADASVVRHAVEASLLKVVALLGSMGYTRAVGEPGYLLDPSSAEAVQFLRRASRSAEIVIVYHTGHGESVPPDGFYLCTTDFRLEDRPDTGVMTRDLAPLLVDRDPGGDVASNQHPTLLILDCCFAGAAAKDIMRDMLDSEIHPQLWVWATAGATQYAVAGRFPEALAQVLSDPPAGPSAPTIPVESILAAINAALASDDQCVYTFAPPTGYNAVPAFFPNPRHAGGVAGLTVTQQRWAISASTGTAARPSAGIYLSGQTGRRRAAHDIAAWMMDATQGDLAVVTGRPGTGKSTMLALPVLLSGPSRDTLLSNAPDNSLLHDVADIVPEGIPLVSIYARGLDTEQVEAEVSARLGLPEDLTKTRPLRQRLAASPPPRAAVIVVDAVDESDDPDTLRDELLIPLAREHDLRVLLGLRLPLPEEIVADLTVDLDSSEYQDPEALVDYAANVLVAAAEPNVVTPYRSGGLAAEPVHDIARAIAEVATSEEGAESFLIAQALAVALRGRTQRVDVDDNNWKQTVPTSLAQAFTEDLNRFGDRTEVASSLLEALAWSKGPGLPWETIWATVAQRLSALHAGKPEVKTTDVDIRWLLTQVGYFVVEDAGPGKSSVFRPFHDRFADYLRGRLAPPTDDADVTSARRREIEATIVAALMSTLADGDQRRWDRAHPYLRTYLAEHARDAGPDVFTEFLEDGGFLAAADPATLTVLMSSTSPTHREVARMYRRCRPLLGSNAAVNAAYLLEAAMALGAPAMSLTDTGITPIYSTVLVDTYPDRSLMSFSLVPNVRALAFGRLGDGPLVLAATNFSQRTRVWDVDTAEPVTTTNNRFIPEHAPPLALGVLPDGRMVVAVGLPDGSVQLHNVLTGALLADSSPTGVRAVAVRFDASHTGATLLLVAFEDGTAQLFSADTCQSAGSQMRGLPGRQVAVVRSDDTVLVACGDNDGRVLIYDGRTCAIMSQFSVRHSREVSAIEFGFSTDGAVILATGHGDGVVQLWRPLSGSPVCEPLVGHGGRVMALAFGRLAPDRSVVASGSHDNTIHVWDTTAGALIDAPLVGHTGAIVALDFVVTDGGDTLLASAGLDNAVRVWGPLVLAGTPVDASAMPYGSPAVSAVALGASARITHLAAFSRYSVLQLRDLSDSGWREDLQYRGHIFSAALGSATQGRAYVALAGGVGIDLWDADAMRHIVTLPHNGIVHNLAFGPDSADNGRLLVGLSLDGILRAWSVNERNAVLPVPISYGGTKPTAMTVTPSRPGQERLAIGDETGTIAIWDPRTDQQLEQYHDHNGRINALAAGTSTAGHMLIASASEDNTIAVRDLDTGDLVTRLSQPLGTSSLAFGATADGRRLIVSASLAGLLTIWDLERQTHALTLSRRTAVHSIAADGLRLAVGDRESFTVIDVDDRAV
jgi:WD40 repeat protein